jgi:hypothetical protein
MSEDRITRIEQRLLSIEKTQQRIYNMSIGIVIGLIIGGLIFGIVTIREAIEIVK